MRRHMTMHLHHRCFLQWKTMRQCCLKLVHLWTHTHTHTWKHTPSVSVIRRYQESISSKKTHPKLNLCCHNLSFDFWLSLHLAILFKSSSIILCGYGCSSSVCMKCPHSSSPSRPPTLLVAAPLLPEPPELPDSWLSSSASASFTLQSCNVKNRPCSTHSCCMHPLAQTPLLKIYQETSSGTHETSHDNAPAPPLLSPMKDDACAPVDTHTHTWKHTPSVSVIRRYQESISSKKTHPKLNLCCHNLSFDFWLSLHLAILFKSSSIILCGYGCSSSVCMKCPHSSSPSRPPTLLVAAPLLPEPPELPDSWLSSSASASFTLQSCNVKNRPCSTHSCCMHPLAQTPLLKIYQETSSGTHETSHYQCTYPEFAHRVPYAMHLVSFPSVEIFWTLNFRTSSVVEAQLKEWWISKPIASMRLKIFTYISRMYGIFTY